MNEIIYFKDNFFSSGQTDIYNGQKEKVGVLDLRSAFSEKVDILDVDGKLQLRGLFPFFSNKWNVMDANESTIGKLRTRFSFFKKTFEYNAREREIYMIESEAFSREFTVTGSNAKLVCNFRRVDGFFESPAYQLTNYSETIPATEWVAVVMGVNAIRNRRKNSAAASNNP